MSNRSSTDPIRPRPEPGAGPRPPTASASHRQGVWQLVNAEQMRELDRFTIEERGVPGEILMESAGRSLFAASLALRAESRDPAGPIGVLCGAGNNGGDGFVLARHLFSEGVACETILLGDPAKLPADAAANWQRLAACGAPHRALDPSTAPGDVLNPAQFADRFSVLVDALFGTGLRRPIEGALASWIDAIEVEHARGSRVLSVDLPSGICADTGQILGAAIRADRTVTISVPKVGLALEPGRSQAGEISVARVGIADPDVAAPDRVELWNARAAAAQFPERPAAGHKGSFGHVLVVGGSPGKLGAIALAARGALRSGAGLLTVAYPRALGAETRGIPVEAMTEAIASTESGDWTVESGKDLLELAASRSVVALGPGLGRAAGIGELVARWVSSLAGPLVLDADALNALRGQLEVLASRSGETILTPHPGEAATLLGVDASAVNADRLAAARALAKRSQSVVILKGAGTVIADASGRALINSTGGPALSAGGTGDVLTGIVAGLWAQGMSAFEAASLAAYWHGAAVQYCLPDGARFGLLASALADALPEAASVLLASNSASMTRANIQEEEGPGGNLELRFPGS